jgi:hypothetical protein
MIKAPGTKPKKFKQTLGAAAASMGMQIPMDKSVCEPAEVRPLSAAPISKPCAEAGAHASAIPKSKPCTEVEAHKKPGPVSGLRTEVEARIDVGLGNALFIRGEGDGLSWDKGEPLECKDASTWVWARCEAKDKVVFKFLLNDVIWAQGEDIVLQAGEKVQITPRF